MISDIATGKTNLADLLFLLAFIVFVFGAIMSMTVRPIHMQWLLAFAGVALLALAWFVL